MMAYQWWSNPDATGVFKEIELHLARKICLINFLVREKCICIRHYKFVELFEGKKSFV
jgi:hypothetical protein